MMRSVNWRFLHSQQAWRRQAEFPRRLKIEDSSSPVYSCWNNATCTRWATAAKSWTQNLIWSAKLTGFVLALVLSRHASFKVAVGSALQEWFTSQQWENKSIYSTSSNMSLITLCLLVPFECRAELSNVCIRMAKYRSVSARARCWWISNHCRSQMQKALVVRRENVAPLEEEKAQITDFSSVFAVLSRSRSLSLSFLYKWVWIK